MWEYRCELERVVDGDTVVVQVDLGFHTYKTVWVRLHGVDTAEIFGQPKDSEEYQTGIEQKQFVEDWFESAENDIVFQSLEEGGKFGRWLGDFEHDGETLTESLLNEWPEYTY